MGGWSAIPEIENGIFIEYYKNEKIHCKTYYKNFLIHREDGPAVIEYNTHGKIVRIEYWLNDEKVEDDLQLIVIKGLESK